MVSLTLLFTSLLPCILHICIFIWSSHSVAEPNVATRMTYPSGASHMQHIFERTVAPRLVGVVNVLSSTYLTDLTLFWEALIHEMKREGIDEMWIAVRLLAGMSSGFGLRGANVTCSALPIYVN